MTAKAECLRILPIIAILSSCLKRGAKVEKMFEETKKKKSEDRRQETEVRSLQFAVRSLQFADR
jgi:hypothetical protein